MKNRVLLLLLPLVMIFMSNIAWASTDDFSTIIWEGVVHNSNYYGKSMKVRITLDGVIGEQISNGKGNVYEKIIIGENYNYTGPNYIIPMVEGGSMKIEYLESAEDMTYQQTELTMGMTYCKKIVSSKYSDDGFTLDEGTYIPPEAFFDNKEFRHSVSPETPIQYSNITSEETKDGLVALIYLPITPNERHDTYLQVFSEREAKSMLKDIKKGHSTYALGKTLEETSYKSADDMYHIVIPKANKSELEKKYGLTIRVEEGFWPEDDLLNKLDNIYSNFPDGLIKEMTSYYKSKGIQTTVHFKYKQTDYGGSFYDDKNHIIIYYYPNPINDRFGEWTIAHEMGHLVHKYIHDTYGYDKFKTEWVRINDGLQYGLDTWTDKYSQYMVRDYSATNYSEDFATLFELLAGRSPIGLRTELIENGDIPLKEKIDLLNNTLVLTTNSVTSSNNLWGRALPQVPSDFAKDICKEAAKLGLIPEVNTFKGLYTSPITRVDFCKLIENLIEKETGTSLQEFTKSKGLKEEWYYSGSISGSGEVKTITNYPFSDTSDETIFDIYSLGIVNGVSPWVFDPEGLLTREQVASILYKTAAILGKDLTYNEIDYVDSLEISSWAKDSVNYVSSKGIMGPTSDQKFEPQKFITYEEAYMIIYYFYHNL